MTLDEKNKLIERLLISPDSDWRKLFADVSGASVAKVGDSTMNVVFGYDIDCDPAIKDICSDFFLVRLKGCIERDILNEITESTAEQSEAELEIRAKMKIGVLNTMLDGLKGVILGDPSSQDIAILKGDNFDRKSHLLASRLRVQFVEPGQLQKILEWRLKECIQLGKLALEPYLRGDKKHIENLRMDLLFKYEENRRGRTSTEMAALDEYVKLRGRRVKFGKHLEKFAKKEQEEIVNDCQEQLLKLKEAESLPDLREAQISVFANAKQYFNTVKDATLLSNPLLKEQLMNVCLRIQRFQALVDHLYEMAADIISPEIKPTKKAKNSPMRANEILVANALKYKLIQACYKFVRSPSKTGRELIADLKGMVQLLKSTSAKNSGCFPFFTKNASKQDSPVMRQINAAITLFSAHNSLEVTSIEEIRRAGEEYQQMSKRSDPVHSSSTSSLSPRSVTPASPSPAEMKFKSLHRRSKSHAIRKHPSMPQVPEHGSLGNEMFGQDVEEKEVRPKKKVAWRK